jgi:hypothetical protein
MSISSLQSIIQKYGANFGIDVKAALKDPAQASGKGSTNAGSGASGQSPPPAAGKIPPADSVNLSPAAKDFLASHTGPLGQFEIPNMMDAFFSALDGTDGSGNGDATGSGLLDYLSGANGSGNGGSAGTSLLDYLSGNAAGNPGGSATNPDPFGSQNPFIAGAGPSQTLADFL